ncbi:33 kDa inner dynein arm light chain, axonemal isoform X3 [Ceratina calcarata]|uniref:33 kDa inner dynein arm light chain, axonemal isoform X3 n=1 Tax=Ceratina calcarata TaxID=156304 RepID=A0AAJ7N522_9HYME|nr:33 kDa inner dynein arm light chain, axonemal isoform X3 [Ceratina calcarata]
MRCYSDRCRCGKICNDGARITRGGRARSTPIEISFEESFLVPVGVFVNRNSEFRDLMATAARTIKDRVIPAMDTLVKYDNPVLVTTRPEKVTKEQAPRIGAAVCKVETTVPTLDARHETSEILNRILPPKQWEEDGQLWTQRVRFVIFLFAFDWRGAIARLISLLFRAFVSGTVISVSPPLPQVSSTPATRLDVINLQEQLDMRLQQRQARETGICPVRRELYTQCFDEVIRQVTVNCAERGLLLLRIRDELKMTLAAYQTLYQSSIAFGMRKALQAEQGKEDLVAAADELQLQKAELEKTVVELKQKFEQAEKRAAELREAEEKKHMEEIQFLKKTNQQLKTQLEGIIAPKR